MAEQESGCAEVKLQVKYEEPLCALPLRSRTSSYQRNSFNLLTSAIQLKIEQNHGPSLHFYHIEIKPNFEESQTNKQILEYIRCKLQDRLKLFTYLNKNMIVSPELVATNQQLIKAVYHNTPIQIWISHRRSLRLGNPFGRLQYASGNNYLKATLSRLLSELNFSGSANRKLFYLPQLKYLPSLPCFALTTFYTSFRWCSNRVFLMVKPNIKLKEENTVLDAINDFYRLNNSLTKSERQDTLNNRFRGRQVISNYGKKKIYTIEKVEFKVKASEIKFGENKRNEERSPSITLIEYYSSKYQLQLTNCNQPILKARSNKPIYLIPEFMSFFLTNKQLSTEKRKKVEELTSMDLQEKVQQHSNFLLNVQEQSDANHFEKLRHVGINIQHEYTTVKAEALDYPTIHTEHGQIINIFEGRHFDFEGRKIYSSQVALNICLIYPALMDLSSIVAMANCEGNNSGIACSIVTYAYIPQPADPALSDIKKIVYIQQFAERKNKTNIFWIIIPDHFRHLYSKLKALTFNCNIESISQITLSSTFDLPNIGNIASGIVRQMAAKVGNCLWKVVIPSHYYILFIGISISPTYTTFCSNTDIEASSFYSGFEQTDPSISLSMRIRKIVNCCLKQFIQKSEAFPTEVIIFRLENRTGKAEQQAETREIRISLSTLGDGYMGLNYFAVSYSHRFDVWLEKGKEAVRPFQGMIINRHIAAGRDFYILNDRGRDCDTVVVCYRVIAHQGQLCGPQLEQIVYDQTFNYSNIQGSAFLPGVLKYAQKLASSLPAYQCHPHAFDRLSKNLYFL